MTSKEYGKVILIGLYKKSSFIFATILGIYFMTTIILDHFKVISYYSETPYFEIFCGIFLLIGPTIITVIAVRQFISNPSCKSDIKYTFGENGMSIQGPTIKAEYLWSHIIKQKEINNFLILYHSKKIGNFIDKSKLTLEQLQFIKSKIEN